MSSNNSSKESSPAHKSSTLPSKLNIKSIEWDEIDELLQVERKLDEADRVYQTMPSHMPSRTSENSLTDISQGSTTDGVTLTASYKTLTQDNCDTTSESQTIFYSQLSSSNENNKPNQNSIARDSNDDDEDTATLKPTDFEDFKRQISEDYINGTESMQNVNESTLKYRQVIDPSRINDSLKLYSENMMNKSVNSEDLMNLSMYSISNVFSIPGQINSINIKDTLNMLKNSSSSSSSDDKTLKHESNRNRSALLKKSISMQTTSSSNESPGDDNDSWAADKGLLRSKSGPNYAINNVSDFESDTMKLSGKPCSSISIKMDCYDEIAKDNGKPAIVDNGIMTASFSSVSTTTPTTPNSDERQFEDECDADADIAGFINVDGVVLRKKPKGSTAIKRRAGNRR